MSLYRSENGAVETPARGPKCLLSRATFAAPGSAFSMVIAINDDELARRWWLISRPRRIVPRVALTHISESRPAIAT